MLIIIKSSNSNLVPTAQHIFIIMRLWVCACGKLWETVIFPNFLQFFRPAFNRMNRKIICVSTAKVRFIMEHQSLGLLRLMGVDQKTPPSNLCFINCCVNSGSLRSMTIYFLLPICRNIYTFCGSVVRPIVVQ